ncbi:MAG: hypothetical protein O2956_03505 [Gemmatimonadetes bacterium]|nr:hypothetical protein [Gemmatimonadota bacterium]
MNRPRSTFLLLAAVALMGCGAGRPEPVREPFTASGRPETIRIIVQNLNFADARLFAYRRGARSSLGSVGGKQDGEFSLPWRFPEPLRIEINLLAGPTCSTEEILVDPGDILELQISSVFSSSSFCR